MTGILLFAEATCFIGYFKDKDFIFLLLPLSIVNFVIELKSEKEINTWNLSRHIGSIVVYTVFLINYFVGIF